MKILDGKNAIITGARRGIGKETVKTFASYGANMWACARKQDASFEADIRALSDLYGVEIWPVYFDVSDEDQVKKAIKQIKGFNKSVDILVNNAGIAAESTSFQMTSTEKMKYVFDNNFFSATLLMQYVSRIMTRQQFGNIVNVASIAAIDGTPGQYEYAASKAAIIGGTKELARELSRFNIRINAVAPGMIETDMGAQISDELRKNTLTKIIMNRLGKPKEVAEVIAFLASDMSSYITGQILRVDGGM